MDAATPHDPAGEPAQILLALRHAMAGPLSAVGLKLDLLERRLTAPSGADPSWVLERVRTAQADFGATNRLLDLLLRLAEIAGERQEETPLAEVCLRAGVALQETAAAVPRLFLREAALAAALRSVAAFLAKGSGALPSARVEFGNGRVALLLEGTHAPADGRPGRLLDLPHGIEGAEALFVARAAVAADGGRLELIERSGRLVALFSWPLRLEGGERKGDA